MEAAPSGTGPDGSHGPDGPDGADGAREPGDEEPSSPRRSPWPPPTALVWGFGGGLLAVLLAAALASFWLAGLLLAGLLALLAVLHLALPISALGPLAVRTPWLDAATCLVLAVGTAVLAVVAPR